MCKVPYGLGTVYGTGGACLMCKGRHGLGLFDVHGVPPSLFLPSHLPSFPLPSQQAGKWLLWGGGGSQELGEWLRSCHGTWKYSRM